MIEITVFASSSGPLTKRISLSESGTLNSDGSACVMTGGVARRIRLSSAVELADLIDRLQQHEAIALGALRHDLPDDVQIVSTRTLTQLNGEASPNLISRTAGNINYVTDRPALALLDFDTKGMPADVAERIQILGGFWNTVLTVVPELETAGHVIRRSTSSGIFHSETHEPIKGSDGVHVFLVVRDGADVERFLKTLHDRCWLHGLGWMMVGVGGQFLERSLIDRMVFSPERLVFEGPPVLIGPLMQDAIQRVPAATEGNPLDTKAVCRSLSDLENAKLRNTKRDRRLQLQAAAEEARTAYMKIHAERIVARTGTSLVRALRIVEQKCGGILLPNVELPFDAAELHGATVGDVLINPERFVGATLADPLEGIAYGRGKAKIMRRVDGALWINSFAHGRTTYDLKYDSTSIEAAIKAADAADAANVFVRLLVHAELEPDEEQGLRDLVMQRCNVRAKSLGSKIKAARADHELQLQRWEREHRGATRHDRRPTVPVPLSDAERLPVIRLIDEALVASGRPVPPMRDLDGRPVEIRYRSPMLLHELTADGSNQNEASSTRLPAPLLPLLTRHDCYSLAHEIEQHIGFTVEDDDGNARPVALPPVFVQHFMAYRDSRLPRAGAIVTAPLVMQNGRLLAPNGLDRDSEIVFQIEPRLMDMLPAPEQCSKAAAAEALDFLCTKWLCDVATDFNGKSVLIALALTMLQRVLLAERPAFFVTAGKRGGGKTTAVMMITLAVTGKRPAAAAWSSSEEERRKAVLAYLSEGLAALVWDNIPLGTAISCPTLEKVLTAESYSDRMLGSTSTVTVPAFTVMTFTGNNISPGGDMASRSLIARLEVDRPDPENRNFKHADPFVWTLENRGRILSALYTIMLANPQLHTPTEPTTRFKAWWHLIGSAVENAAAALVDDQFPVDERARYAHQVNFASLFAAVEETDEEGMLLADVLDTLHSKWKGEWFLASDVARFVNAPSISEGESASILRAFFDPSGRRGGDISTRAIGHRLGAITGTPVFVGERSMQLRKRAVQQEKQKRASAFAIAVK